MKITLDSAILVRAFASQQGVARELLAALRRQGHILVLSNEILAETSRVLRYPRMMARHAQAEDRVYEYVMFLRAQAMMVQPDVMLLAPIRDPNDIIVIQTALIGGADTICTTDEDFFNPPASEFLALMGIRVLNHVELIKLLRS